LHSLFIGKSTNIPLTSPKHSLILPRILFFQRE
jgi:hypothetical protein